MVVYTTRPRIKDLSLRRRHLGMTALMSIQLRKIEKISLLIGNIYRSIKYTDQDLKKEQCKRAIAHLLRQRRAIKSPPIELNMPLSKLQRRYRNIDSFEDEVIPMYFRFRSKDQLRELIAGLRIPIRIGKNKLFVSYLNIYCILQLIYTLSFLFFYLYS
jgi:hypothetical protein